MDPITQQTVLAAAGAGGDKVYVDDVFSTYSYDGNSGTNAINNGLDLAGEGGLVWCKRRDAAGYNHHLYDTERGVTKYLSSNVSNGNSTTGTDFSSFNSNGFTLGTPQSIGSGLNATGADYVSWTFRKAPGFFDVVTWTGNGSSGLRAINHNLGSTPGFIITKNASSSNTWMCWHKDLTNNNYYLQLNETDQERNGSQQIWDATDTTFSIHSGITGNQSGNTFVAYLFADDDASFGTGGDESIIKCGTYTGSGSSETTVNLGFEPQFVIIKRTSSGGTGWVMYDNMRGVPTGDGDKQLLADESAAETNENRIDFYSQGFKLQNDAAHTNHSGQTYIYMAIRRPNKPPEVATEVFAIDTWGGTSPTPPTFISGFPVDAAILIGTTVASKPWANRLMGIKFPYTNLANAEDSSSSFEWDYMNGWMSQGGTNSSYYSYMFKRAPGFFDVVTYSGTSSNRAVNHNLEAVPELMFVKVRNHNEDWNVYNFIDGPTKYLRLNLTQDIAANSIFWNNTAPTSSVFNLGTYIGVNGSGKTYVAYLFATLPGISKVGTYTGTGNAINVNCGFTNGARFVLIKRRDSPGGSWYVWDTARGIVSGNDKYLFLNDSAAQVTNTDYIDPLNAGFTVTSSAPAALNASGGTYLFLAIA